MILCCGEALIDMLPRELPSGDIAYAPHAGGAVFNTAIALGRLGSPAGFFCGLSKDMFGDLLIETLKASHVETTLSPRLARPCTLAFVKLVDGQATYAFYDENSALKALTPEDVPKMPENTKALFFGGISLAGEPCGSAYEAMLLAASKSHVIMLDPNVRPSFVTDRARYTDRITRMMAASDIVKLSDEDLLWLMGEGEIENHVEAILSAGTKLVLITKGAEGVSAYRAQGFIEVPAQEVDVVDTVGAGDTFNAGFLAALEEDGLLSRDTLSNLRDKQLKNAIAKGAKVAAVTVSRAGANPPWAHEL